ncbi:MAG: superoxide dismutase family protein [Elusimicrobia bacterium]|nr:superoxide dismutase family protein [Elusimicrobiota bacterium]
MTLWQRVQRVVLVILLGPSIAWAAAGVAKVQGTNVGSKITGTVSFQDTRGGVKLSVQLANVPPGTHGFHIHEFGSCEEQGKAAGGHYNPRGVPHGFVPKDGLKRAHAGDLGNIMADPQGNASLEAVIPGVSLSGSKYAVGGRAVIVHEKADDFGQPVGNAGGRIGCGLIVITGR